MRKLRKAAILAAIAAVALVAATALAVAFFGGDPELYRDDEDTGGPFIGCAANRAEAWSS